MTDYQFENQEVWSPIKKMAILFAVVYLLLYMLPFPLDGIPGVDTVIAGLAKPFDTLNLWVGHRLLRVGEFKKIENTGSGDTQFDYVKLITNSLLTFILSIGISLVWKNARNYKRLLFWTTTYARYYVGLYMVVYGCAKLFDSQFAFPSLDRLDQTFGTSSPMGLLWTFMGYSKGYTVFSGVGEIIGGVLLLFRRTTVLGCMITIGIMINVFVMNLCYDVPVKLFSAHLILITLFILAPYLKKIFGLFFFSKETAFTYSSIVLPKKWLRISRIFFKALIVIVLPALILFEALSASDQDQNLIAFDGIYKSEEFKKNGIVLQPSPTDTIRWDKMTIENEYAKITTMADSIVYYRLKTDTLNKQIILTTFGGFATKYTLNYSKKSDSTLSVSGVYKTDTVAVSFKRKLAKDYCLVNRGFHWINEYPYNR